ncbi:hypothetical protein [Luedemannella helvata]|uniref:Uncharacterized protein n=1 Tax=Luedemannella helvata TaxID=349315 RepID=A0ABN2K5E0_9ACTN
MTAGTKLMSFFRALFAPHYPRNYIGRHRARYAIPLPVSLVSLRRG